MISEFVPPPIGKNTFKDYRILYHTKLIPPALEIDGEIEDDDQDIIDENQTYETIVIPNLDKVWLKVKPS